MPDNTFLKIGAGPDLVFLHGWKHDKNSWTKMAELLKNDFTCWLVDLPQFGSNSEQLNDKSPFGYASWVEGFVNDQKIERFSIVGHSFGGRIATIIASRNPGLEKLIIYG